MISKWGRRLADRAPDIVYDTGSSIGTLKQD